MKEYTQINKLVRDFVPREIEKEGYKVEVNYLTETSFPEYIEAKLLEEVTEYIESRNREELADILEVVYTIGKTHGISEEKLNSIRQEKLEKKGGFDNKIFLISKSKL